MGICSSSTAAHVKATTIPPQSLFRGVEANSDDASLGFTFKSRTHLGQIFDIGLSGIVSAISTGNSESRFSARNSLLNDGASSRGDTTTLGKKTEHRFFA